MAIHDYECKVCHHVWEVVELNLHDEPIECPHCGSSDFQRAISWHGMFTGEHKKAWDRPPPGNKIVVGGTKITSKRKPV